MQAKISCVLRFDRENAGMLRKKGIGLAVFLHGAGFTGSGERYLNSLVGVDATVEIVAEAPDEPVDLPRPRLVGQEVLRRPAILERDRVAKCSVTD